MSEKYITFDCKLGMQRIRLKKYSDFSRKSEKLKIQIKNDYNINWEDVRIGKNFNYFLQNLNRKVVYGILVSLMQTEGKTNNRKTVIMFSFDDFSAPGESQMFIFWLFHQFTTQLYTHAILMLLLVLD